MAEREGLNDRRYKLNWINMLSAVRCISVTISNYEPSIRCGTKRRNPAVQQLGRYRGEADMCASWT